MLVTNQMITQVYLVPEITTKLLTFDRLRWFRSGTGRNGYYEPVTALVPKPATMRAQLVSRALTGKVLRMRINGTVEVELALAGPDPVTMASVAQQIDEAVPELSASGNGSLLILETVLTGTAASIEILACDAAAPLGLLTGEAVAGLGVDNPLLPGISEYRFSDHQSSPLTWYAVQFVNSTTGLTSPRSITFLSRAAQSVPLSQLIGCFVRLCDLSGRPLGGRRVTVHNVFMPNRVAGDGKVWGVFRQYEEMATDPNGYAECYLIRGATIDFTIAGTGFTRRIVVPTAGSIVDLLDPALSTTDEFGIQVRDWDFAVRTTT